MGFSLVFLGLGLEVDFGGSVHTCVLWWAMNSDNLTTTSSNDIWIANDAAVPTSTSSERNTKTNTLHAKHIVHATTKIRIHANRRSSTSRLLINTSDNIPSIIPLPISVNKFSRDHISSSNLKDLAHSNKHRDRVRASSY